MLRHDVQRKIHACNYNSSSTRAGQGNGRIVDSWTIDNLYAARGVDGGNRFPEVIMVSKLADRAQLSSSPKASL